PPDAKAKIEALVGQIRLAFKGRIERVTWMSQETKAKALDKLARVTQKLGYPNKWRDYSALEVRPDDVVGNMLRGIGFEWLRQVKPVNGAGRPRRMGDDAPDGERLLQSVAE